MSGLDDYFFREKKKNVPLWVEAYENCLWCFNHRGSKSWKTIVPTKQGLVSAIYNYYDYVNLEAMK